MKPKRLKRRLKREQELGPERDIVSYAADKAVLSCGHVIVNPPRSETAKMRQPNFYRCIECKEQ
jgi:hypothetical protein